MLLPPCRLIAVQSRGTYMHFWKRTQSDKTTPFFTRPMPPTWNAAKTTARQMKYTSLAYRGRRLKKYSFSMRAVYVEEFNLLRDLCDTHISSL